MNTKVKLLSSLQNKYLITLPLLLLSAKVTLDIEFLALSTRSLSLQANRLL